MDGWERGLIVGRKQSCVVYEFDTEPPPACQDCLYRLTPAEFAVAREIYNGLSLTGIAEKLCVAPVTVTVHKRSIARKLNLDLNSNVLIARWWIRKGLGEA